MYLSIRHKIIIALAVLAFFVLGLGAWSMVWIHDQTKVFEEGFFRTQAIVECAHRALQSAQESAARLQSLVLVAELDRKDLIPAYRETFPRTLSEFRIFNQALMWGTDSSIFDAQAEMPAGQSISTVLPWHISGSDVSKPMRQLAGMAHIYFGGFTKYANKSIEVLEKTAPTGSSDVAEGAARNGEIYGYLDRALYFEQRVSEILYELIKMTTQYATDTRKQLEYFQKRRIVQITAFVFVSICVALLIASVIADRAFVVPLSALVRQAERIGQGRLEWSTDIKTGDEIGLLARAFREMMASLRKTTVSRDELKNEVEERKEAEVALEFERTRLKGILDTASDVIISIDREARIILFNTQAERSFGYTPAEATGKSFLELLPLWLREMHGERPFHFFEELADSAVSARAPLLIGLAKEGREFPMEITASKFVIQGQPLITIIARDITERIRAEEELREREEQTRAIVETAYDAFVGMDAKGYVRDWNKAAEQMFGWKREEAVGQLLAELIIPLKHREMHRKGLERFVRTGEGFVFNKVLELSALHRTGTEMPVELIIWPTRRGSAYYFHAFIRDLTEKKRTQRQLREAQDQLYQAEKMQSVGRLASGVAHEVKNPLGILLQSVDYLSLQLKNPDENMKMVLTGMADAVRRADDVIRGMLDFASATEVKIAPHNIHSVLLRSLLLVKHELESRHIEVRKTFDENLPDVNLDPGRMEQVFVNLLMNAISMLPERGHIHIRTYRKKFEVIGYGVGRRQGDVFRLGDEVLGIDLEDNGPGIAEENLNKIFEPFFTTRRGRGGTGLGLSVVQGIVQMHGGLVRMENCAEGGARATVWLKIYGIK